MRRQANSDPLPFVQVDRAVKPKAALLANALGVTTQHALGSLVEWWELCGDPRELETIVEASVATGEEPAVLLDAGDVSLRFKLASGKDIDPVTLVRLGLLEPVDPGRFRVRGMSRYFQPIKDRLELRERSVRGGIASAEARRKKTGTAQPTGGRGSEGGSAAVRSASEAATEAETEPGTEPRRNHDRSATEHRDQRSEIRDLKEDLPAMPASQGALLDHDATRAKPSKTRSLSPAEVAWSKMQELRQQRLDELQITAPDERHGAAMVNSSFKRAIAQLRELDPTADEHDLVMAFKRYLHTAYGQQRSPAFALAPFLHPSVLSKAYSVIGTADDPCPSEAPAA